MKRVATILSMAVAAAIAGCEAPQQAEAPATKAAPSANFASPMVPAVPDNANGQIAPFPLLTGPSGPAIPSGAPGFSGLGLAPINSMEDLAGLQLQADAQPVPLEPAAPADQGQAHAPQGNALPVNQIVAADTLPASNPASQPVVAPVEPPAYTPQYVYVPQYVVQPIYIEAEPQIIYQPVLFPYSFGDSFFFIDRRRRIDCSIVIHDRDRDHDHHGSRPAVIISQGNRPPIVSPGSAGHGHASPLVLPIKADPSFINAAAATPPAKLIAAKTDTALFLRAGSAAPAGATPTRTIIATPAPLAPAIATGPSKTSKSIETASPIQPAVPVRTISSRVVKKLDPTPAPEAQPLATLPTNVVTPQKSVVPSRVVQNPGATTPVRTPTVVRSADDTAVKTVTPKPALVTKLETASKAEPPARPAPVSIPESRPVVITPPAKTPDRIVIRDTTPDPQPIPRPMAIRSAPTPAPISIRSPDPIVVRDPTPAPVMRPIVPIKTLDSAPSGAPSFTGPSNIPSNRPGRTR